MTEDQITMLAEMHTDIKWIRDSLNGKAGKWTETFLKGMIGTTLLTVLGALLALIIAPVVTATVYYSITTLYGT